MLPQSESESCNVQDLSAPTQPEPFGKMVSEVVRYLKQTGDPVLTRTYTTVDEISNAFHSL